MYTYDSEHGTMTTELWAEVMDNLGEQRRRRLFELGLDIEPVEGVKFQYPIIVIADAFSGHAPGKDLLVLSCAKCRAVCEKWNIKVHTSLP